MSGEVKRSPVATPVLGRIATTEADVPAVSQAPAPVAAGPAHPLDGFSQPVHATAAQRLLGVGDVQPGAPARVGASRILEVLGTQMAPAQAVQTPGVVTWVNYDLARELGFDVPASSTMTPEFEAQLLEALSFRLLRPGEDPGQRRTLEVHADRYGGVGVGDNLGAGRAAFLPWGNLNVKGVGLTPLARPDPDDFQHSHGGAPLREGMLEAIWGEVNQNLFSRGSTRILAVIDTKDFTEWPDGTRERRALIVRAGTQFRPAHLLDASFDAGDYSVRAYVRATHESGDLVTWTDPTTGRELPDLEATQRRIVDHHARAAAEQFRARILHGALGTSNMELSGAQLDLATETAQPRTAPIRVIDGFGTFGTEHQIRAQELELSYHVMLSALDDEQRASFRAGSFDHEPLMQQAYRGHLEQELLQATGLKQEVAQRLRSERPALASALTDAVLQLASLTNEGVPLGADKHVAEQASVVDVFNALRHLPADAAADGGVTHEQVMARLRPTYLGTAERRAQLEDAVSAGAGALQTAWNEVMTQSRAYTPEHYGDERARRSSIQMRASFENTPLDRLYKARLDGWLNERITEYERRGDPRILGDAIDDTISASLRRTDALLRQGTMRPMPAGGLELQRRTVDGVGYSVRAFDDGRRRLAVTLPLVGDASVGFRVPGLQMPPLSAEQVRDLRYRFTTDGWATHAEAGARVDGHAVSFEIPFGRGPFVGHLEGLFHTGGSEEVWVKDGASNFRGYTFAIPDDKELESLRAESVTPPASST